MKICNHGGVQTSDDSVFCPNCGQEITSAPIPGKEDKPSVGLNILSFLFPVVGLILYLVQKKETPVRAKKIGKWALIGFIIGVVLSIALSVIVGLQVAKQVSGELDDELNDIQNDIQTITGDEVTRSFLSDEGDGFVETMTFVAKGDMVITMTDSLAIDVTGYTDDEIDALLADLDNNMDVYAALDFCVYSSSQTGGTVFCTLVFSDLDDDDNVEDLYEVGFLEDECDFISMKQTADSLLASNWQEVDA